MTDKTPIEKAAEDICNIVQHCGETMACRPSEHEIADIIRRRLAKEVPKQISVIGEWGWDVGNVAGYNHCRYVIGLRDMYSGNCESCKEGIAGNECPASKRNCGHHCNHIWYQDECCWCGETFDEEEEV